MNKYLELPSEMGGTPTGVVGCPGPEDIGVVGRPTPAKKVKLIPNYT